VIESVRLAVSEAVTNAVLHAYDDNPDEAGPRGEVQVTLALAQGEFWVLVADEGHGHQSAPSSPGLGWGLALIADACRHFLITERSGGGTELRMGFSLGARPQVAAA
jgi:anti-sigma regulatory factor (Ser/Thr protein kinase)